MKQQNNKAIIFSAPSGAGKTTIVHYLLNNVKNLSFSISACSRNKRENEVDGKDYHFFSVSEFKQKIKNNEFVEWEEVYKDNFYGTLKTEVDRIWKSGKTVIFDVDVVGGINLKKYFGDNALSVFVKPPSILLLEERLRNRKTETEESINRRIGKAKQELEMSNKFDYILLNDNLNKALNDIEEVVTSFLNNTNCYK